MLRQRVKGKESDRYISARSAERDKIIEKYTIKDVKNEVHETERFSSAGKTKNRTPLIISDEKQYTQNLYLSLLKSQIFDTENVSSVENTQTSSAKKKKKANQKGENSPNIKTLLNSNDYININSPFGKKLFSSNSKNTSAHKHPKFNVESLDFESENTKPSFKKLINFEIEEREYTTNFLRQKQIPKIPYKVLDAPNLKDDFYLHLIDWSSQDNLAVGLEKCLYIWEGKNSKVNLLNIMEEDHLTSVCWLKDGNSLLVGTSSGKISLWDVEKSVAISSFTSHTERVGIITTMNCNENIFTSGSQDKMILNYDIRDPEAVVNKMYGHSQEVCGLKWSPDDRKLASGGNDNKLFIWNAYKSEFEKKFSAHTSAVKALDWSPHKFGCLLSGGGTQDRTIKIWNINTMKMVESIDTSSQVCNIAFSKNSHEFVSTHGYSDNFILVWDSDKLDVKATLKGHKDRVIYLSTGADPKKIVTGAGDETIRFWDVFMSNPLKESTNDNSNLEIKKFNIR